MLLGRIGRWRARRIAAGHRGQSLVEFAFGLPLLLLILLGTLDLGQMFFEYIDLRNAVREGASYGARNPTDTTGIKGWVTGHSSKLATGTTVTVNLSGNYTTVGSTGTVTVTGTRTFTPITTAFLQNYFGLGPVTLTSSSSARVLS
jgi:Flp pilus assembly protein TadG